ncbi:hypothetical protein U9M48_012627 [Paspalum notatum var. saurae]|uniref:Uncharacterized protein n=1 Tax=Paspalum notatum var. saurae TaxID=547442 RepID=A0AAQ3WIL2_PASNO
MHCPCLASIDTSLSSLYKLKQISAPVWATAYLAAPGRRREPERITTSKLGRHGEEMEVKCRRLEGKVAVVTASTQGIGLAIAERLGLEGAAVVISSRKQVVSVVRVPVLQKNVDEAVEGLKAKGITAVGAVCHVSDAQQRKNLIDTVVKNFGHIDILVSNAAANPSVDGILEMKESVLDKLWDINVKASILLLQDAAPHLRKGSSVIIVSSIAGYNPEKGLAMYGVTKTALFGLTKVIVNLSTPSLITILCCKGNEVQFDSKASFTVKHTAGQALAGEMGPDTRVNCIAPGFVPTRFASFLTTNETIRKELVDRTTLKRLGSVEDMAAAAAFLASDDASFITAETIVVAGGTQSRL